MKKLLILLMVVAMASFLFVGCIPGVIPDVDVDVDEEVPAPTSTPPTIIDIQTIGFATIVDVTATDIEYIDEEEAAIVVLVVGIAKPKSLVQVYIGSAVLPIALGETQETGLFQIVMTISSLGDDGAKTIYATATEAGLEESASSNVVKFTLDTAGPEIVKVTADISKGTVIVTFDEAVDEDTAEEATWEVKNLTQIEAVVSITVENAKLISPKVVKLEVTYGGTGSPAAEDLILVTCDGTGIEDLAGNITTDFFEICALVD